MNVVGNGLKGGAATFTGQNFGAEKYERIRKGIHKTILLGLASSLVILIPVEIFSFTLIRFLIPDASLETLQIGTKALRIEAACLPALYLLCEYRASTSGLGNTVFPMVSGFIELFSRLFSVYVLENIFSPQGLYSAIPLGWLLAGIFMIVSFYTVYKKRCVPDNC